MRTLFSVFALVLLLVPVPTAKADDTGFASMHDLRRERGKLCMTGHFHSGTGSGRTKRKALREAVRAYAEFTAWEYGTDWARWSRAASKSVSYTKESSGWTASVDARPCRRGGRR